MRILFSFDSVGDKTTNPFTDLLFESVRDAGAEPVAFSWRVALLGRYDVLHLHWPEMRLRGDRWNIRMAQDILWAAVLARARVLRRPIAQTQHNVRPHEDGGRGERAVLRLGIRWTTLWIRLVDEMQLPDEVPVAALRRTIPHGTYAERYRNLQRREQRPGRVLFFGLIRAYKGIDVLLESFEGLPDETLELRICGEAREPKHVQWIEQAAARDPRISARLEFLPEDDLIAEIGASELVVLPYREMNNSGAAILALSQDRPIVVPDGKVTAKLSEETGSGWVARYQSTLTTARLADAIDGLRSARSTRLEPAIQRLTWAEIATLHLAAYGEAIDAAGTHDFLIRHDCDPGQVDTDGPSGAPRAASS